MFLRRYLRGTVLAVMFVLAAATTCLCDSYDPDPYDDAPPVVILQFQYLVSEHASAQVQNNFSRGRLNLFGGAQHRNRARAGRAVAFVPQDSAKLFSDYFQTPVPLRC
ncbi:MAG TPA: hypothetical protein VF532_23835 [Candidatus Angelobacter sp.]